MLPANQRARLPCFHFAELFPHLLGSEQVELFNHHQGLEMVIAIIIIIIIIINHHAMTKVTFW